MCHPQSPSHRIDVAQDSYMPMTRLGDPSLSSLFRVILYEATLPGPRHSSCRPQSHNAVTSAKDHSRIVRRRNRRLPLLPFPAAVFRFRKAGKRSSRRWRPARGDHCYRRVVACLIPSLGKARSDFSVELAHFRKRLLSRKHIGQQMCRIKNGTYNPQLTLSK